MKQKEKIITWLAGLISTDGSLKIRKGIGYCTGMLIYSTEKAWLERIKSKLAEIEIDSKITPRFYGKNSFKPGNEYYSLYIHRPREVIPLFREYHCEEFFNPRKWKNVLEACNYYSKNPLERRYISLKCWSQEEERILKENFHLSDKELEELLPLRSRKAIQHHRLKLGLKRIDKGGRKPCVSC